MRFRRPTTICLFAVFCLSLPFLSGCGKGRATVKGKVTFNSQPLTVGTVGFVCDGQTTTGQIKPDGTYIVKDVPVGEATITVTTPPP
jgi:hypothetical protein